MTALSRCLLAFLLALATVGVARANERININSADAATLDRAMDGVGPAKAAAIVEHRRVHGPFRTVDQLVNVKGIGPATLEANRARLIVGPAAAPAPARTAATAPAPRPVSPAPRVN